MLSQHDIEVILEGSTFAGTKSYSRFFYFSLPNADTALHELADEPFFMPQIDKRLPYEIRLYGRTSEPLVYVTTQFDDAAANQRARMLLSESAEYSGAEVWRGLHLICRLTLEKQ